ncbi:hypothetical protein [Bacteroides sp. Marseille-P3684]|uniref:Imm32 family immunity protein n=1 Tax=Bacteroides sp. Marseille-P3684 TaxID=2086579 RepID=UPI000D0AFE59|nr:hypothetical protein [Bacteroides sp. Marseille-P3684]
MKVILDIPSYSENSGIVFKWEGDFQIKVVSEDGDVYIKANADGLTSLANHLLNLAQTSVPIGTHIHLDEYNSLEEDSLDLIIEKI